MGRSYNGRCPVLVSSSMPMAPAIRAGPSPFERLLSRLHESVKPELPATLAYLEHMSPDLDHGRARTGLTGYRLEFASCRCSLGGAGISATISRPRPTRRARRFPGSRSRSGHRRPGRGSGDHRGARGLSRSILWPRDPHRARRLGAGELSGRAMHQEFGARLPQRRTLHLGIDLKAFDRPSRSGRAAFVA